MMIAVSIVMRLVLEMVDEVGKEAQTEVTCVCVRPFVTEGNKARTILKNQSEETEERMG
jgi:hypothetical protein